MSIAISVISGVAIADYSDLVDQVQEQLDRDDLSAMIPRWIAFCEARMNRRLRTPQQETVLDQVTSAENTALPDDFLQMRTLHCEGSPDRPLRAMSPAAIAQSFDGSSGIPVAYALRGRKIKLAPPPGESVTLTIDYYAKVPALSESTPSNWVLEDHPDLYFAGVLWKAAEHVVDPQAIAYYRDEFNAILDDVERSSSKARWGAGPLVPFPTMQVRGGRC